METKPKPYPIRKQLRISTRLDEKLDTYINTVDAPMSKSDAMRQLLHEILDLKLKGKHRKIR